MTDFRQMALRSPKPQSLGLCCGCSQRLGPGYVSSLKAFLWLCGGLPQGALSEDGQGLLMGHGVCVGVLQPSSSSGGQGCSAPLSQPLGRGQSCLHSRTLGPTQSCFQVMEMLLSLAPLRRKRRKV